MTDKHWYAMLNGQQEGPFAEPQFRDMIARRQVTADTMVWASPMADWAKAGTVPDLFAAAPASPPTMRPGPPGRTAVAAYAPQASDWPGGEPGAPLAFTGGVWGLFGRGLLVMLCQLLIIPSPWANAAFYRWFVANVQLPNQRPVRFEGKGGDIWYIFMLLAICSLISFLLPLTVLFYVIILRWFFAKLVWDGRSQPLRFTGGYWALFGWLILSAVSFITIIGWAWVYTAMTRWICRHVEGSSQKLSFVASGWSVLWRIWVLGLACSFIIPIPWMIRWYVRWMVSQFALSERM